ncbi:MAG TPA: M23 family metallopeptidase [Mariprofundaceae bacterium]|nr:M23 family metallopeptidase [Mariprofundaceae bacterium]
MALTLRILLVAAVLVTGGCYYTPAPYGHRETRPAVRSGDAYAVYSVRPGDTMYSIAKRFGIDYKLLARRNRIPYPYTIYVGQELFLTRMAPPSESIPTPSERVASRSRARAAPSHVDVSPPDLGYAHMQLIWPVTGKITSDFGNQGHRMHDGIDIAAPQGTPVRAAADGEVVYSDNRMAGYGRLIIIRHAGDLFTAYAHNQRNLVARGDRVKRGEIIARVGETGRATGPHLHFEVRRGPTPVNPLAYLPRR